MTKINVLRVVTCFYPGTIQLPLMKFYPLESVNNSVTEWTIKRNFKALNIIDYRRQLKDLINRDADAMNAAYTPKDGNFIMQYSFHGEPAAHAELINMQKEVARNVDRILFDTSLSELMLMQYHYEVDLPDGPGKTNIPFDTDAISNSFKDIISIYIKGSGDWTIDSPYSLYAPIYYESFDIYFDNDIPKEEMQQALLLKKDHHWDYFTSQINLERLDSSLRVKVKLDTYKVDSNVSFVTKNRDNDSIKATELFTKIRRDISISGNYKYALLESFTFAEAFITEYLTQYKIKAGISKTKISDFEKEIGISYKLNVELPLILRPDDAEKELISGVEAIRKRRNKIIHGQGATDSVTEGEALGALTAVQNLYVFMSNWSSDKTSL